MRNCALYTIHKFVPFIPTIPSLTFTLYSQQLCVSIFVHCLGQPALSLPTMPIWTSTHIYHKFMRYFAFVNWVKSKMIIWKGNFFSSHVFIDCKFVTYFTQTLLSSNNQRAHMFWKETRTIYIHTWKSSQS